MRKMSDAQIGRVAGFIDGEGAVSIKRKVSTRAKDKGYVGFAPFVIFTQKKSEALFMITEWLGMERRLRLVKSRDMWVLEMGHVAARELFAIVRPHLIAKSEHARIVLEMPTPKRNGRRGAAGAEILSRQISAYEAIRLLQMKVNNRLKSRKQYAAVDGRCRYVGMSA